MSKCTKGKLETIPYTRRDGDNIRWVKDAKGQSICRTFKPRAEANAKELVRRWNAFEDGGIIEELRTACEELVKAENHYASSSETLVKFGSKIRSCCVPLAKAALAKI